MIITRRSLTGWLLVAMLLLNVVGFAQNDNQVVADPARTDNPVVAILEPQFGSVLIRDLEGFHEFTFSAPFDKIETILNLVVMQEWYPTYISISCRPDEKAAIIMRASISKNAASERFAMLQQLVTPGLLPWKTGELNNESPAVTAVETDFSSRVSVLGQTLKSGLIFTQLFPMLQRAPGIRDPFFERGSYRDSPSGRLMEFSVKCNW
ncbi:MAG TPA: hypothetical protein PLM07_00330 [Candidatus Rifleibacterium sp.]|nr:hypothetical protein [Candidatus Rifleibacterium sp.]HPT44325.1 hypothetical protein [Candidatus Rifleibacterium sp.]